VGAGPAGLVSALSLVKNGIQIRIVDKAEQYHVGSRGFGVQPRTFELFQTLGVLEDIQKYSTPIPTMRAYKLPGGTVPVKTWDLYEKGEVWPDRPFANGACLSQRDLEDVLRAHLAKYGVAVECGKGLVAVTQDVESVAATLATFKDGEPLDDTETVVARYLIGADGGRGASRKLLGLTFQGETRDADGMVWGDVEINGLMSDFWHIWGKPGHFTIMARPLSPSSNKFGLGITGQNFDPTDLADPVKVVEFFQRETGREDLQFGEFTWLSYFKPNMRMVNKFQQGRVFVVGDAAHVHSPTGGQGMNCSVQDASNLTWKLSLVLKNLAPASLLGTYNEERLPVITQMLHATSKLYTHAKKSGWFRWRNSALEMYGINYRYSDIVLDERSALSEDKEDMLAHAYAGYEGRGTLCAGDRAPEASGLVRGDGEETSLLRLFCPAMHTVVVFGDMGVVNGVSVKNLPGDCVQVYGIVKKGTGKDEGDVFVDRDGHAYGAYMVGEGDGIMVVVRPDGFIGAVVKDWEGVETYFGKIFGM
ncbi:hypothetical protein BDZ89DRAFT_960743, partial [Hymenopellis radicata]